MQRPHHNRPLGFRPREGPRFGNKNNSGWRENFRDGRNESLNSTERYITVSSDGSAFHYSELGIGNFGDPSLVESVINSRKIIGEYSEDAERNFVNDRSNLKFLLKKYLPDNDTKEKVVDLDLNISQAEYKAYTSTGNKDFENFLTWIINNEDAFQKEFVHSSLSIEGCKFAMQKSVLTNLLVAPYALRNNFKFYAYSFKGVIYFQKEYSVDTANQISSWAHKFEQLMTEEDTSKKVICNEEFRAVISSNLGPHKILYFAALDCANSEEIDDDLKDLSSFITLKSILKGKTDSHYFRFQMLLWFLHYVFVGVPKTLVGQRTPNGLVKLLKLYDATDLPLLGKEFWNPVNCLFFVSEALSFIKKKVESEPGSVFCIRKESGRRLITCNKDLDYENFLPEWFTREIL